MLLRGLSVAGRCVGDARQITDAATSSGTNVVTSGSAAFTSADVGRTISIKNGSSSLTSFVGTILSVTNSTTVVVSANVPLTVSGAKATIGTNNNASLASTCTAAGATMVYVPPGDYMTVGTFNFSVANQTIFLARGARLLADGSTTRPFGVTADGIAIVGEGVIDGNLAAASDPGNSGASVLNCSSRQRVKLCDFTLQNAALFGVVLNGASRILVLGCTFTNCWSTAVWAQEGTTTITDIKVKGCFIDSSMVGIVPGQTLVTGVGIAIGVGSVSGTYVPSNVRIIDNMLIGPPATTANLSDASMGILGAMHNSLIALNEIVGYAMGMSPEYSNGLTINCNTITAPLLYGIELPAAHRTTVTGNVIDCGGVTYCAIILDGSSNRHTITGNEIYNTPTATTPYGIPVGVGLLGSPVTTGYTVISGNVIEMTFGYGVLNASRGNVSITGNQFLNAGTAAYGVQSTGAGDISVLGNQFAGGFTNPVSFDELTPQTRARMVVIGNSSDTAQTFVKGSNLTLGSGCRIHSNGADVALTGV